MKPRLNWWGRRRHSHNIENALLDPVTNHTQTTNDELLCAGIADESGLELVNELEPPEPLELVELVERRSAQRLEFIIQMKSIRGGLIMAVHILPRSSYILMISDARSEYQMRGWPASLQSTSQRLG